MTMKTPEQIATEAARKVLNDNRDNLSEDYFPEAEPLGQLGWEMGEGITFEDALRQIVAAAIEANRAQCDIIAQVAEALDGRGAHAAAELVRDADPVGLWNSYIGPMIDSIEDDYTGMAKEINA